MHKWNLSRPIQINRGNGISRKQKSHKQRRECTSISIGGMGDSEVWGDSGSWEYDERTLYYNGETFSEGPNLITGRFSGHAAGLLRDKDTNEEYIAVVGGNDLDVQMLDSLELLKIGDNKWKSGNLFISSRICLLN